MLIFELPVLLLVLRWYRHGSAVAPAVLAGVLAFFTYYYVSQVFGIAQNRLFPLYVAAAGLAGFSLVLVALRLNADKVAAAMPAHPGRRVLAAYLIAVAAAATLAWLPGIAALTLVAGGLLARMAHPGASNAARSQPASLVRGSGPA